MTTFGQSCYYYISLFNFIKMFFRLIGVHILFLAKNSFLTYVYIQFGTEISPTKQPLIPRLAQKIKGRIRAHISFLNVQSFLNVGLYTVQSVTEHPKTTSVSQPDSKKIQRLIGVHILFVAKIHSSRMSIYSSEQKFTTKQPLIPRLARKKRLAVLGTYLVFEYTILPERMSAYSPVSD